MAIDNSKVLFSSNWDIDQGNTTGFTSVGINANTDTVLYTFPAGKMPVFDVQFKPSTESYWYMPGWNMNQLDQGFFFESYILGNNIYARSTIAGTVRYVTYLETIV